MCIRDRCILLRCKWPIGPFAFNKLIDWLTSCLRSTTSNDRSCTSQLRSGTFLLVSTTLHSLHLSIFLYAWCFVNNAVFTAILPLSLSMLGVDRCCKRQTLLKCHKIRVPWMLKNRWSAVGNPTSALGPSDSSFGPSSHAPVRITTSCWIINLTTDFTTLRLC